jgi:hypothetical protein
MCKNELFQSSGNEKQTFQNLGAKNKFHAKFRDENNSLPYFL